MDTPQIPVIASDWWSLCPMPDLGELAHPEGVHRQNVVDHSFMPHPDGGWRCWACIRGTAVSRILYEWRGPGLEEGPWECVGVPMRADARWGEHCEPGAETLGAPFFYQHDGEWFCYYHTSGNIHALHSPDGGRTFHRQLPGRPEFDNRLIQGGGRDTMILFHQGWHYTYSTVSEHPPASLARSFVCLRRTRDPLSFRYTDYSVVNTGGIGGNGPVACESPFVVFRHGYFYLFRASSMTFDTYVYRSRSPFSFGCNDDSLLIATLPVKAPEIVVSQGRQFISDLADFQGLKMARLDWVDA